MPLFSTKKGAKHKQAKRDCSYESIDVNDLPNLHKLVYNFEKASKLKAFIAKKVVNINDKDEHGRTALHIAASVANQKALHAIMQCELSADVEIKDKDGKTALFKAVEVFSPECALALIEHGASTDVWDNHESTPLHIATVNKKPSIIAVICHAHGNVNIKDKMGYTPLHVAAAFGYLDIGKQLIESGAKVNSRDAHGRTPLMAASCEGTPKMVHLLLANGANPNLVDNFKHSAIDYSTQNQSESMTKILKEAVAQRRYSRSASLASKHEQELFEANVNALPSFRKPEVSEAVQERQNISMEHATPFTMNGEPAENDEFTKSSTMVTNDEIMQNNMNGKNGVVHENIIVDSTARKTLMRESELIPATPGASDSGSDEALEKDRRLSEYEHEYEKQMKLVRHNKELRAENARLQTQVLEYMKEASSDKEKKQREIKRESSRQEFINLRNQRILEEKIKQCAKLERKMNEAYDSLLSEIDKAKDGKDLDQTLKNLIKDSRKKLRSSEAKVNHLSIQLKHERDERKLLLTEVESLRGEVTILNGFIQKKESVDSHPVEVNEDSVNVDTHGDISKFYEEELQKKVTDNKALLENLNGLRKENALLKEQHLSNKHETQMLNYELSEARDQLMTLQYQLEKMKLQASFDVPRIDSESLRKDSGSRRRLSSTVGLGRYLERTKSDSTVHGFRTFDSTQDFFGGDNSDISKEVSSQSPPATVSGKR